LQKSYRINYIITMYTNKKTHSAPLFMAILLTALFSSGWLPNREPPALSSTAA